MEVKIRDLFNNIGKPQFALLNCIYDLEKDDIKELREIDRQFLNDYDDWKYNKDRKMLINLINKWCETHRCWSLYYKKGQNYGKK